MANKKVPIVAIVGRANVGKSCLFNAILSRREAIVADEPGTTRDSIFAKASYDGQDFWIVDTAGMKDAEDDFEFTIQEQILQATDSADVILVVVAADAVISDEDRKVAKLALRAQKPVFLVVNKMDKLPRGESIEQFARLGIKPILETSATQRNGVDELMETVSAILPRARINEAEDRVRIALLGRPNVGKSALFNTLAVKQQAIVADRAGTTRDINRTVVRYKTREIEIMDTAGIRRSGKIEQGVERFSVIRSLAAIEQSDVCLLLVDVNELAVALDQKIAGLIKEAGKGLIIVITKWDSIEKTPYTRDEMAPRIRHAFDFVPWAPLIFTSSETGQNVSKLFDLVMEIIERRNFRVSTSEMNRWLHQATTSHPPSSIKAIHPHLTYAVQEQPQGEPTFQVHGSHVKLVHWSYRRYLERQLREKFDFSGTPIKIWLIEKKGDEKRPYQKKAKNSEAEKEN